MLQAVIKNKLQRHLMRDGGPPEDLITDCFFGPLRYLGARDAGRALEWICRDARSNAFSVLDGVSLVDIELWPRSNRVEPDALVRCNSPAGHPIGLIVEVKWNAPLGQAQAVSQWREFSRTITDTECLLHLIICRERTSVERDIEEQEKELEGEKHGALVRWRNSRLVLTWYDIAKRLRDAPATWSPTLQRWADDARAVLRRYGERPFEGFASLTSTAASLPAARPVFWAHESAFRWPLAHVDRQGRPLFWQSETHQ